MRIAGLTIAGAGVAGLGVSAAFFGLRQKTISDLDGICGMNRMSCPDSAMPTHDRLVTYNYISIGTFVGGASLLAIGGALAIVSTRVNAPKATVGIALQPGGGTISGTF
jgi:hypothetical protein